MARLREHYQEVVRGALAEQFGYRNPMQVPRLAKIVVNMGVGEATQEPKKLQSAMSELALITGQKPALCRARKSVAKDIEKVLRSAIANAQQKDGFGGDVDRLYVSACYANQGPSMKRVRPAPMGRAYRVVKRTAHLTVRVAERPLKIARVADNDETQAEKPVRARKTAAARKTAGAKA